MIEQMTKNLYCSFNRTEKIIIVSYIKHVIIQSSVEKIFKEYLKMPQMPAGRQNFAPYLILHFLAQKIFVY